MHPYTHAYTCSHTHTQTHKLKHTVTHTHIIKHALLRHAVPINMQRCKFLYYSLAYKQAYRIYTYITKLYAFKIKPVLACSSYYNYNYYYYYYYFIIITIIVILLLYYYHCYFLPEYKTINVYNYFCNDRCYFIYRVVYESTILCSYLLVT